MQVINSLGGVSESVQIAVRHYWGHHRMTADLCDAVTVYGATTHAPMVHEPALVMPGSSDPRVSLSVTGVQFAEELVDRLRFRVWPEARDLVLVAVWCLGAFQGASRALRERRQIGAWVVDDAALGPARRYATISDVVNVLERIAGTGSKLTVYLVREWLTECESHVRWHRPVRDRELSPEFWMQPMRAHGWVWLRRQSGVFLPPAVAEQASWLLRPRGSREAAGTALGGQMLIRQRQSLAVVQSALARVIDAAPEAVWASTTQVAIRGVDVYAPGQRFPGQITSLRARARFKSGFEAVRSTFRVPDGAIWRPGDHPGKPSILVEHEADRGPVAARHVLDAVAYSALWRYPHMTMCVIVSPAARRNVVERIERLRSSAEYEAICLEFPEGSLMVRVVDERIARAESVLTCPAHLEITL